MVESGSHYSLSERGTWPTLGPSPGTSLLKPQKGRQLFEPAYNLTGPVENSEDSGTDQGLESQRLPTLIVVRKEVRGSY